MPYPWTNPQQKASQYAQKGLTLSVVMKLSPLESCPEEQKDSKKVKPVIEKAEGGW